MFILGINAYHADVSAVLLEDGRLLAAVEEERFRRIKHCAGFPRESIRWLLKEAGIQGRDVDHFAVSRDPRAHLARKLWYTLRKRPSLKLIRSRLGNRRQVGSVADELARAVEVEPSLVSRRLRPVEHHPAHLASTFLVSPFEEAAVCAIDGFGDFVSTSLARGRGNRLQLLERVYFPHSLGELYLALTQYLGFSHYGDEYKVMGLAAYGIPEMVPQIRRLLELTPGGAFKLQLPYFQHWSLGDNMTFSGDRPEVGPVFSPELERLLGPARRPDEPVVDRHKAIAASLQAVFEEAVWHLLRELHRRTGQKRLCLAGGCAMNSVANGKIRSSTPFQEVYIQPAAADNGTSLGAALYVWNQLLGKPREFVMNHALWGPEFSNRDFDSILKKNSLKQSGCLTTQLSGEELYRRTAESLAQGKIVGWFQGRLEWGARALGNRSILADPRRPDMREIINRKIKFRESFRPFAPAILEEHVHEYFEDAVIDPFMLQVYPVKHSRRSVIPAVTHVDGSGRLQTVSRSHNPVFWNLISAFHELTGVPVLLNTSFNENEPIVHRPQEALDCFLRTDMDVLVLGPFFIQKAPALECGGLPPRSRPAAGRGPS